MRVFLLRQSDPPWEHLVRSRINPSLVSSVLLRLGRSTTAAWETNEVIALAAWPPNCP